MCIAAAIFLARNGKSKSEIKKYIIHTFGYSELNLSVEVLREKSNYSVTCQDTVPLAVAAFLESTDFESAIKLAISYGSDSDTIAAVSGSIAEAYYKEIPLYIADFCKCKLDKHAASLCKEFFDIVNKHNLQIVSSHKKFRRRTSIFVVSRIAVTKYFVMTWNQVVGYPLVEQPTSHTTIRTVRYTAVQ